MLRETVTAELEQGEACPGWLGTCFPGWHGPRSLLPRSCKTAGPGIEDACDTQNVPGDNFKRLALGLFKKRMCWGAWVAQS